MLRQGLPDRHCRLLLLAGITIGGTYYYFREFAKKLTSDKPVAIRVEQPTDAQMQAAATKAQALTDAYNAGKEVTVELTGPDFNALIARNPKLADFRGAIYFSIANNEISAEMSTPLNFIGWDMFKDRYFNGHFVTFFEWNNGEMTLKPKVVEANGKQVPEVLLSRFASAESQKQLNDELKKQKNVEARNFLNRFKSIRVVGDRLIIVTRAGPPPK